MTPAARLAAAIEILDHIASARVNADDAVRAWGKSRRFAGSGDRRAIAQRVYAVLRARPRIAWRMGEDTPRALVLGSLLEVDGLAAGEIAGLFSGDGHAPAALSEEEARRVEAPSTAPPEAVEAGVPDFVADALRKRFGDDWLAEAKGLMGERAPVDLRVNTLRGDVEAALRLLAVDGIEPEGTPFSSLGLRLPARYADVQGARAFKTGWVEVQDEASQIAAALTGPRPGDVVIDWCAGGGGKTLALAALMAPFPLDGGRAGDGGASGPSEVDGEGGASSQFPRSGVVVAPTPGPSPIEGEGNFLALDIDAKRLAALGPRLDRSGANAEVRKLPKDYLDAGVPADIPMADLVFVDAPCSGSGTWRRHPEAAWRLQPATVERLSALQRRILAAASTRVKIGGRLAYATCSVLPAENETVAAHFLAANPTFRPIPIAQAAASPRLTDAARDRLPALASPSHMLQMTPRRTGTDGFFIALFQRTA